MFSIAYHSIYNHPVPENHRFPMEKYQLLPKQLLLEGIVTEDCFFKPAQASLQDIYLAHNPDYVNRYTQLQLTDKERRKTGFVHCQQLIDRELTLVQGTIDGALNAFNQKVAFNIAGGTHHAFSGHGEGFCMLNDQAVAAAYLLKYNKASKILIVDLDVHQGNGTAEIFKNNPQVFTFSMHGKTLKTEIGHREHLTSYRRELLARSIANAAAESIYDGADYGDLSAGAAASAPVKIAGGDAALYAKISMQKFDSVYVIRAQVSEAEDFANGATTSVTAKVPLPLSAEEKRLIWSTVN